ncbi:hypothetical protein L202_07723 [Cryptococcus amylolentus CBS 6039]|uniref:Uncharacterized protein n=2 Tax=Cryptococcus amylolentus TaxID=104669 RepID=A0A1E3H9Y8_9TREE|nr:hypothetical protein L202_07723 [Cryptococcus amylolentus CBS 6039]ODN73158.1 hypothetical protein L202_07723 [Cryptococcus amylolentus CBS 6039]ODN98987.1 hypothetical protein I350_07138 [Cryptococcus amylolentus CBS 6273]
MSLNHHIPKKISLKPKAHHGFQLVLWLLGLLLPPLAVAVRFGIGVDFFINVFLCICGYIPCHFHNFYIQNIRNNQNRARTPKWAIKYGLVDNSNNERRAQKNLWAKRFEERNNHSTLADQELEAGEEGPNYDPYTESPAEVERRRNEGLWSAEDEEYYNADRAPNQKSWHYPANFEGTVGDGRSYKRKGKSAGSSGGDRWQRAARRSSVSSSTNTYPPSAATEDDIPEWGRDYGSKGRKSGKKQQKAAAKKNGGENEWARNPEFNYSNERAGVGYSNGAGVGAGGGGGGGRRRGDSGASAGRSNGSAAAAPSGNGDPNWDHQF